MIDYERLLPQVAKPARYTGGEWNQIVKDWSTCDVRMLLAYPELYEIGMSNLGIALLYDIVNSRPEYLAERAFSPWVDMEALLERSHTPIFSLESKQPAAAFDIIGFSIGYELKYSNVLTFLNLAHLPIHSKNRTADHPLIIAGGSCSMNPEPLADFIDAFVLGEGEEIIIEILDLYRDWKRSHSGRYPADEREALLFELAQISGVYVPRFYDVAYNDDSTVAEIVPNRAGVPARVQRRALFGLKPIVTRPIVPHMQVIHDRAAIEIQRGCTRGCRFCQAGTIYRPMRYRSVDEMVASAEELIANTGFTELALLSLSSMDHPEIAELCKALAERLGPKGVSISMPSTRVDRFNVELAEAITFRKRTSLTFAPEAGTERLRAVISKNVSEEELLNTVETAFSKGWIGLKLYFMVGLPTETMHDVHGIVNLAQKALAIGRRHAGGKTKINIGVSTHIPKPHTPFQWSAQIRTEDLVPRQELLQRGLRSKGIKFSWNDPLVSLIEGVFSRGDRRVGKLIQRGWELGARFDSWEELFDYGRWKRAAEETGTDLDFYNHRERDLNEVLPWDHIDSGVGKHYLMRDYRRAQHERASEDCMYGECYACGIQETEGLCYKAIPPKTRRDESKSRGKTLTMASR